MTDPADDLARRRAEIARTRRMEIADPTDESVRERLSRQRGDYAEAKIEAYVAKVVAAAPPLTDDQRLRLASLFLPPSYANAA